MSDLSPNLSLPLLAPSQAQKHVTQNEALALLDAVAQLAVASRCLSEPPADPAPGAHHILPAVAGGAWSGQVAGALALWDGLAWRFLSPAEGWRALVLDEGIELVWRGGAWGAPARLGVNAAPDATNRLVVSAHATLLTHDGAGHQLKLNKTAAGDTASLLFQTGWSGRAEMGCAGGDDFSVKVSADGSAWQTAVSVTAATGRAMLGQAGRAH